MIHAENIRPFFRNLATLFGVGRARKAPGTWGTLAAVPVAVLFMLPGPFIFMALTVLTLVLAIVACDIHEQDSGSHDSQQVVIDEVVGYLIAVTWLPFTWQSFLAAFVLFRIFDIWKPLFIGMLDRKVHGGIGTVIDDLAAGLVVNIILQFVYYCTDWLGHQWAGGLG